MPKKTAIGVGNEVEALCNKCKGATVHVIEVIKGDKITKVMCKSCLNSHRYRPAEEKDIKKAVKIKRTRKSSKTKEERKWNKLLNQVDSDKKIDYAMDSSYSENDVISHERFGVGIVVKIVNNSKISVFFQDGQKNLVQNYSMA